MTHIITDRQIEDRNSKMTQSTVRYIRVDSNRKTQIYIVTERQIADSKCKIDSKIDSNNQIQTYTTDRQIISQ